MVLVVMEASCKKVDASISVNKDSLLIMALCGNAVC